MKALKILTLAALISTAGINAAAAVNDFGVAAARARIANIVHAPLTINDINNLRAAIRASGGNNLIVELLGADNIKALGLAAQMFGINGNNGNNDYQRIQFIANQIDRLIGDGANRAAGFAAAQVNNVQRATNVLGVLQGAIVNQQVIQAFNNNFGRQAFAGNANAINDIGALIGAISQNNIDNIFNAAFNIAQAYQQHAAEQEILAGDQHVAVAPDNNNNANAGGGDQHVAVAPDNNNNANAGGGDQQPQQAFPKLSVEQIMQKTQLKRSIAEGIYNQVASKNGAVLGANDRLTNTGSLSSRQVADLETALRQNEVMVEDVQNEDNNNHGGGLQQNNNEGDDQQPQQAFPKLSVEQIMQKTQLKRSIAEGIYNQVASKNGAVLDANDRLTNTGSLSSRQVADLETALRQNEVMAEGVQNEDNNNDE